MKETDLTPAEIAEGAAALIEQTYAMDRAGLICRCVYEDDRDQCANACRNIWPPPALAAAAVLEQHAEAVLIAAELEPDLEDWMPPDTRRGVWLAELDHAVYGLDDQADAAARVLVLCSDYRYFLQQRDTDRAALTLMAITALAMQGGFFSHAIDAARGAKILSAATTGGQLKTRRYAVERQRWQATAIMIHDERKAAGKAAISLLELTRKVAGKLSDSRAHDKKFILSRRHWLAGLGLHKK